MDSTLILLLLLSVAYALPTSFKSCDCVCGVRGRNDRIVGGKETDANEYPWMVGLFRGSRLYCGGAIVSDKHVLTAAHCVHPFKKSEIKVYLGGHNISADYIDTRRVRRIHEHENFDPVSFDFDIALLELDKTVLFGSKIQPACLPDEQFKDYSGKVAMIAGWGRLGEQEQISNTLRQVIVPIWSKEECHASDYGTKRLTDNMMCAGYQDGGSDACQGDSGGPMNFEGKTGSMEVIGVVSWGGWSWWKHCFTGCARKKLPGIYTRVNNFLPWIQKKLNGQCLCTPKEGVRSNFLESLAQQNRV